MHFGFGIGSLHPGGNAEVVAFPTRLGVERVFEFLGLTAAADRKTGRRQVAFQDANRRTPVRPAHDDLVFPQADVDRMARGDALLELNLDFVT